LPLLFIYASSRQSLLSCTSIFFVPQESFLFSPPDSEGCAPLSLSHRLQQFKKHNTQKKQRHKSNKNTKNQQQKTTQKKNTEKMPISGQNLFSTAICFWATLVTPSSPPLKLVLFFLPQIPFLAFTSPTPMFPQFSLPPRVFFVDQPLRISGKR